MYMDDCLDGWIHAAGEQDNGATAAAPSS